MFSAPMVRALLAGIKTQTRRVVKKSEFWPASTVRAAILETRGTAMAVDAYRCTYGPEIKCPYGMPGDRLWVKETHWRDDEDGAILYAANLDDCSVVDQNKHETGSPRYNWKPSIFMPRAASRITLEVTGVRVERLQDISEADAQAEGIRETAPPLRDFRLEYSDLWASINGDGSWHMNPWVWVIEFKVVKP